MTLPTTFSLAPKTAPVGSRVRAELAAKLRSGTFSVGQALPPERELASQLGVARGTLRAALNELERDGFIGSDGYRRMVQSIPEQPEGLLADTIAVISPHDAPSVPSHRTQGWEDAIEMGISRGARRHGLSTFNTSARSLSEQRLGELLSHPLKGLIITAAPPKIALHDSLLRQLGELRIPVAVYGDYPQAGRFWRVASDHASGAQQLTDWLIARGRKRILRLWPSFQPTPYWLAGRNEGYARAVRQAGLEPLEPLYLPTFTESLETRMEFDGWVMMLWGFLNQWLQSNERFDAIMASSDRAVFYIAAALRKLGIDPQKDVQIVGYDNYWQDCRQQEWEPTIPAATVDKDNFQIGQRLVELLTRPHTVGKSPELELVSPKLVETSGGKSVR
jgi:DNA-binding LacI/PurR family transcriptional regulator